MVNIFTYAKSLYLVFASQSNSILTLNTDVTEVTVWVGKLSKETSCFAKSHPACS